MSYPIVTTYGEIVLNTVTPHPPAAVRFSPQVQTVINKTAPVLPPTQQSRPPHGGGLPPHGPIP